MLLLTPSPRAIRTLPQGDNVTELLIVVVGEVMVAEAGIDLHAAFGQYAAGKGKGDTSMRGSSREPSVSASMGGGRSVTGRSMSNSVRGAGSMRDLGSMRSTGSMADGSHGGGRRGRRAVGGRVTELVCRACVREVFPALVLDHYRWLNVAMAWRCEDNVLHRSQGIQLQRL